MSVPCGVQGPIRNKRRNKMAKFGDTHEIPEELQGATKDSIEKDTAYHSEIRSLAMSIQIERDANWGRLAEALPDLPWEERAFKLDVVDGNAVITDYGPNVEGRRPRNSVADALRDKEKPTED
jgi:hypothetical protein